jgi:metal-responsive CopG/Arc/MetJ family transcriptional regulator
MDIITINLPKRFLKAFETLLEMGKFPNRSKLVRQAIKEFLEHELQFYQDLGDSDLYEYLEEETC